MSHSNDKYPHINVHHPIRFCKPNIISISLNNKSLRGMNMPPDLQYAIQCKTSLKTSGRDL